MRGDTSDRVAAAELTAPATRTLVARAEQAVSLIEVHQLVGELRALPGIVDAALEVTAESTPGDGPAQTPGREPGSPVSGAPGSALSGARVIAPGTVPSGPGTVLVPVGPPAWRLALRVRTVDGISVDATAADGISVDVITAHDTTAADVAAVKPAAGDAATAGTAAEGADGRDTQDRAAQDRAAQDRAAQDRAAQDRAAQDRAAAWPAVEAVAAAAHNCLTGRCRAMPADRVMPIHPLSRALLDGDRAVVVVIDPAVGWAALSEAFDLVLGYDRQAPPAVSLLDLVHPEDQPLAVGSYVDVCAGRGGGGPFDLRVRTATGRWRTIEVAVRGLLDDPPVGAVAYLGIDATAQRASERSLREEVERLRNATQAGGASGASGAGGANGASGAGAANGTSGAGAAAFMPSVAHELRGPLSSVVAFGHLLGDPGSGTLTDDQRAYLDVIDRNANRLLRLIEELLLLSRLQAGAVALKPAAVRVPALVEEVVAERAESARAVGVALAWDAIEGVELVCDEARVQQALANLLANGLAFTPADGRVTIAARPIETGWQFVVSDTGIGIPAADQPKLFTPFFRASNVGSVNAPDSPGSRAGRRATNPGAGLGLSISRAIVELHGGVIDVASTEGVGTTVTVSLPLHPRMKDGG